MSTSQGKRRRKPEPVSDAVDPEQTNRRWPRGWRQRGRRCKWRPVRARAKWSKHVQRGGEFVMDVHQKIPVAPHAHCDFSSAAA